MRSNIRKILFLLLALAVGIGYPYLNILVSNGVYSLMSAIMQDKIQTITQIPYYIELFSDLITGLIYAVIWILTLRNSKFERPEERKMKERVQYSTLLQCIVIGAGVLGLSTLWVMAAGKIPMLAEEMQLFEKFNSMNTYGGFLSVIVLPVILAPIIEEIAFRGIVFQGLEKVKKGILPVLLSAFLFGLMHMMLVQSVYAFIMGFIAGIIYSKKRNLLYPIVIHMTNNLLSSVQAAFPQTDFVMNIIVIAMILPAGYFVYKVWKQKENKAASLASDGRVS